jgi:hypothetical protein
MHSTYMKAKLSVSLSHSRSSSYCLEGGSKLSARGSSGMAVSRKDGGNMWYVGWLLKTAETMVRSSATGAVLAWRSHEQTCMKRSAWIWMEEEVHGLELGQIKQPNDSTREKWNCAYFSTSGNFIGSYTSSCSMPGAWLPAADAISVAPSTWNITD